VRVIFSTSCEKESYSNGKQLGAAKTDGLFDPNSYG